jgi:hypothetical protein
MPTGKTYLQNNVPLVSFWGSTSEEKKEMCSLHEDHFKNLHIPRIQ